MSNIRPIGDPAIANAMVATFQSIDLARSAPAGISSPRWRILQCAHAGNATSKSLQLCSGLNARALAEHVQALRWKGLMDMDSYRLSPTAIRMVEDCVLALAPTGKAGTVIVDEYGFEPKAEPVCDAVVGLRHAIAAFDASALPHLSAPVIIGIDLSSRADLMITHATPQDAAPIIDAVAAKFGPIIAEKAARLAEALDPADVPACMRPDCMSVAETNTDGRGSAAVARPIEGVLRDDRVAPGRAPETLVEVAGSNPAPGQPATPPKFVSWIEQRAARIAGAIAFLKSKGVLVTVVDRDAQVREYFVSGKRYRQLAEEVVEIAIAKGWAE